MHDSSLLASFVVTAHFKLKLGYFFDIIVDLALFFGKKNPRVEENQSF